MHAPSDVRFALNGACSVFAASVGIDDEVGTWGSGRLPGLGRRGQESTTAGLMSGGSGRNAVINVNVAACKNELRADHDRTAETATAATMVIGPTHGSPVRPSTSPRRR